MATEVLETSCCPSWGHNGLGSDLGKTMGKAMLSAAGGPKKGVMDI